MKTAPVTGAPSPTEPDKTDPPAPTSEAPAPTPAPAPPAPPTPDALRAEGATTERERILSILEVGRVAMSDAIKSAVKDPTCTKEGAALKVLEAERAQGSSLMTRLRTDESRLTPPDAGGQAESESGVQQAVRGILSAGKRERSA